jgi:hypothetical protein
MSRTAKIVAEFGGDEYDFCLRWGELIELQESRDAGPAWILSKFSANTWQVQDVSEILRLGLIGGGMEAGKARKLIRNHVELKPFDLGGDVGLAILAVKVLAAGLHGSPDEPEKLEGRPNGSTISPEERSDLAPSSAVAS